MVGAYIVNGVLAIGIVSDVTESSTLVSIRAHLTVQ